VIITSTPGFQFQHPAERADIESRRPRYPGDPGQRSPPAAHRDVQDPEGDLVRAHAVAATPGKHFCTGALARGVFYQVVWSSLESV
jgi:hypothetical protein